MSIAIFNFNNSYQSLGESFFEWVKPTPVQSPGLLLFNQLLANELGLPVDLSESTASELEQIFSGNQLAEGSEPMAQAYAGHQFGYFTMLGDGRAIL
ncbi:MAG: hypothetical protein RL135_1677, partial [Bacteroidota bacterium]